MFKTILPYAIMVATGGIALWRGAPYATLLFLLFLASWVTVRVVLTRGAEKPVIEERGRRRERTLTTAVFVGMIILPILTLATPLLDFAAYRGLPGQVAAGPAVALAGLYVFWRSHEDLGKNWSAHLEVREGHRLVTGGIYARMRHPMYTAIFLITVAQLLILTNWIAGPAGLLTFLVLYMVRIGPEEQLMADRFGADWEAYAARTPRLIPKLGA
ncbi:MAG: protein-S-isoprenylcysteine O-methyltransferase [Rhodobacteraceae bacterium]|nr:protein-S-isoprenylcysteine O-methyltransferase [Paracoccaceae bacterium]